MLSDCRREENSKAKIGWFVSTEGHICSFGIFLLLRDMWCIEFNDFHKVEAEQTQERPAKRGRIRKKEEKEKPEEETKKHEQVRLVTTNVVFVE